MSPTLFVTATGTDVGKTFVACALLRELTRRRIAIEPFKPVLSGFDDLEASDAGQMLRAVGRSLMDFQKVSPLRFKAALAPPSAARAEGVRLELAQLTSLCRERMTGPLLIEGAGGVMSPIAEDGTNLDLIVALGAPALLVTGSYLGAVSHTLTAIEAMRVRGVEIPAIVVSESAGDPPPLTEIEQALARFAPDIPRFTASRRSELQCPAVRRGGIPRQMSDPVQIIARGSRHDAEAAAAAIDSDPLLEAATYSILEEDEDQDIWRIDAFPNTDEEADGIERTLLASGGLTVLREVLADADWLAMALSGLPPVRAGRFFIYGAHDKGLAPDNTVNLRIEAGAAFGTGHHGTTVGCLAAYDRLLKRRGFERVLDVGCGTGVLAIAAARTGTKVAVGTDIDAPSVRIANDNARLNRARSRFVHAPGLAHRLVRQHGPYDLVFANILARPLIALSSDIKGVLEPGGIAILSGLLRTQARTVTAAYLARGYRLIERTHRDAWTTLVLLRP